MASRAGALSHSVIRRSYQPRSIRILVIPTPVTFAERRSILQVIEQYGPIEVFRRTKDYHANFITVTKDVETAQKLLQASPLTYSVSVPELTDNVATVDLTRPSSFDPTKPLTTFSEVEAAEDEPEQQHFRLEIYPLEDYNHANATSRIPAHNSWPLSYKTNQSFMTATLAQSLPESIAAKGLASWDNDPNDTAFQPAPKEERLLLNSWTPTKMIEQRQKKYARRQSKS